ncbi:MAG TPA: hopanoid biosynthesis-associated protein HpnK [Candidatus Binataceae bacterium]|nr:hopanoid biosynthesis-associated protein HpnK [Candidatus Binataceae bacterium]
MKRLIVNGDDFGRTREVNAGIIRAHREGILTSASLMVADVARDEAVALAKENPALDVGLHLVVCMGRAVLPPAQIAPLVDTQGNFSNWPVLIGLRYFFSSSMREKLKAECRAQIELHLKLIGYLNHIDGHLNFHVHPAIADIVVELAHEYKVPCIRIPAEPLFTTMAISRARSPGKLVESIIFRTLSRRTRRMAEARGIKSSDRLFGLHQTHHITEDYVVGVIDRLPEGLTEMYFHPALDIGRTPPPPSAQRETEVLTGARVREAVSRRGIELTTFGAR